MSLLRLERLERRDTPAGAVTATLNGSTWTIVGDDLGNNVLVNPGAASGEFVLTGLVGTVVTGESAPAGVKSIVFKMGDGDDSAVVNNTGAAAAVAGNLVFDGGDGESIFAATDLAVGKNVTVTNGDAADIVAGDVDHTTTLRRTDVAGKVSIRNGDGNSQTTISGGTSFRLIGKGLSARYGLGSDSTVVEAVNVVGVIAVAAGTPADLGVDGLGGGDVRVAGLADGTPATVGGLSLGIPLGSYAFTLTDLRVAGSLKVDGAREAAVLGGSVAISGVSVGGKATVRTGDSVDSVAIDDGSFRAFALSTGGGADDVQVEQAVGAGTAALFSGKVRFDLGDGDDSLRLGVAGVPARQVRLLAAATFDGGAGADDLFADNVFAPFGGPTYLGFEA